MLQPVAVVGPRLMMEAKAVAGVPTCTERLPGNTEAAREEGVEAAAKQLAPAASGVINPRLHEENWRFREVLTKGFMINPKGVEAQAEPDWLSWGASKLWPISCAVSRTRDLLLVVKSCESPVP